MSDFRRPAVSSPGLPAGERGMAMVVVLFSLLVLALLTVALGHTVLAEVESERLVQWDERAAYLAEAAVEHQIALLAQDRTAGRVGTTPLPPPAMASGFDHRYRVKRLRCLPDLSHRCMQQQDSPEVLRCRGSSRWCVWGIDATGELAVGGTVVQERTVCALVRLDYPRGRGSDPTLTVLGWLRAAGSTCNIPAWDLP